MSATDVAFASDADLFARVAAGDSAARDALLEKHLGLVHHVAAQLSRRTSTRVEHDEMLSAGTLGLIGAIEAFDPSRETAFSSYAAPRIRGAILDDLRRQDHVPRSYRYKARRINAARTALVARDRRSPDESQLANVLGVQVTTLRRWEWEVEGNAPVSIDSFDGRGTPARGDLSTSTALADTADGIDARLEQDERVEILRAAILRMQEQARAVLGMYYVDELQMKEIGSALGVSESRVSQIRKKALASLKAALEEQLEAA